MQVFKGIFKVMTENQEQSVVHIEIVSNAFLSLNDPPKELSGILKLNAIINLIYKIMN